MEETSNTDKKTKLRFTCADDINLLKETLAVNPFEDVKKWKIVLKNFTEICMKEFSLRAIKDHVQYLLTLFRKEEIANLRRSGTKEMYREKESLLQQLLDLKNEFLPKKVGNQKHKIEDIKQEPLLVLEANKINIEEPPMDHSLRGFDFVNIPVICHEQHEDSSSSITSTGTAAPDSGVSISSGSLSPGTVKRRSASLKKSLGKMLCEQKAKELEVEEKKIALEEKRIALENRKLDMEVAKMDQLAAMQQQQMQMFARLMEKLSQSQ